MATVLANPAKMIERGAPHLIRTEEQLAAYTKALYRLTLEPRPTRPPGGRHRVAHLAD